MPDPAPLLYGPNGAPISSFRFLSASTNGSQGGPSWPVRALDPLRKLITYRDWLTTSYLSAKIFANFGTFKGAICEKTMRAIGNAWMPFFLGEDEAWGKLALQWLVEQWFPNCNVKGPAYDFRTSLFVESLTCDRDGDQPILLTRGDSGWPMFQHIPPRQIGQWDATTGYNQDAVVEDGPYKGRKIRNGIIMNDQERPIAYRKLGDNRGEYQDIPEKNIIHLFEPEWTDCNRGLPIFSASIEDIRMMATSDEWEQRAMTIASALGLIEYNERGGPDLTDPGTVLINNDDGTPSGLTTKTIFGGMVRYFRSNSGAKLEQFINQRPGDDWEKFQDRQIRKACAGANWPYELAWKREAINSTSQRSVLEQARGSVTDRQGLLKPGALRKIQYALSVAMKPIKDGGLGILPPYPGKDLGGFLKWDFTMPPAISIDPGRDRDQARQDFLIGFETLHNIAGERGGTWINIRTQRERETRDLIQRAKGISRDEDIPFEVALALMQQQTANANTPGNGSNIVNSQSEDDEQKAA